MAARKPRVPRPKKYKKPDGSTYDSIWEAVLHEGILKYWEHHTEKVPYVTEHTYEPDFKEAQRWHQKISCRMG